VFEALDRDGDPERVFGELTQPRTRRRITAGWIDVG
jgi:hypothetical protein